MILLIELNSQGASNNSDSGSGLSVSLNGSIFGAHVFKEDQRHGKVKIKKKRRLIRLDR